MTKLSYSIFVSYSVEKMYFLINNINEYSEFIPHCKESRILKINHNQVTAKIKIFNMGIEKSFITCNTLKKNKNIQMNLIRGPVRKLVGNWSFFPINPSSCKIKLKLDLEFSSFLDNTLFHIFIKKKVTNIMQSFVKRAKKIYSNE